MESITVTADIIDRPIFALCTPQEERFLRDLMRHTPHLATLRCPEGAALLYAVEELTGGERGIALDPVPTALVYHLAVYAHNADTFTPEERDHPSAMMEVHAFLQQLMQTVAGAIRENTCVRHTAEGMFIDLFEIPQWFYNESEINMCENTA